MTRFLFLVLVAVLCAPAAQAAKIYKWVDENGRVHFGEKPPKGQASEEIRIKVQAVPAVQPAVAAGSAAAQGASEPQRPLPSRSGSHDPHRPPPAEPPPSPRNSPRQ